MAIAKLHPFGVVTIGVALATVGLWGQQQNRVPAGDRSAVTQADVERWKQELIACAIWQMETSISDGWIPIRKVGGRRLSGVQMGYASSILKKGIMQRFLNMAPATVIWHPGAVTYLKKQRV